VLLQLTERGHRIVTDVTTRRREEIASIVVNMPAQDRAGLVRALRSFAAVGEAADNEVERRQPVPGWE
jgi:DNA-binding MarR family transcriptional regulator